MSIKFELDAAKDETPSLPDDQELSKDEVFFALSNYRRRYLVHYLKQTNRPADLRELSEQIAAWENEIDVPRTTSIQRKRVYVSLRQTHLPKMDDLGIVEFDSVRGTARLTDRVADLDLYLEVNQKDDLPWSGLYFGLGSIMCIVAATVWMNLPPFTLLPTIAYVAGFAALFTLVALVHLFQSERMRLGTGGPPL